MIRRRARYREPRPLGPERSTEARAVMAWVDGLTEEQREAVYEWGEGPVKIALALGYRAGFAFRREVREAAQRAHERALRVAVGDVD